MSITKFVISQLTQNSVYQKKRRQFYWTKRNLKFRHELRWQN